MAPFPDKPPGFSKDSTVLLDNAMTLIWLEHVAKGAAANGIPVPAKVTANLVRLRSEAKSGLRRRGTVTR